MKRPALAAVAAVGLALGAFAQGTILVDNSTANNGVADLAALSYYSGAYGLELFELSPSPTGAALTSTLAAINGASSGLAGYAAMTGAGFLLENTWTNQTMSGGFVKLGQFTMPDVSPAGAEVLLGLAVWNTPASFAAMLATPGARLGVIAFPQSTALPSAPANGIDDLGAGWDSVGQDLVMTPVPEPGVLALAGLGAAAGMVSCRRAARRGRLDSR